VAKLGVIGMSVITAAVAVTSCGQGERSLFSDTTARTTLPASESQSVQSDADPDPSQSTQQEPMSGAGR
jgi:hypothetical protein